MTIGFLLGTGFGALISTTMLILMAYNSQQGKQKEELDTSKIKPPRGGSGTRSAINHSETHLKVYYCDDLPTHEPMRTRHIKKRK